MTLHHQTKTFLELLASRGEPLEHFEPLIRQFFAPRERDGESIN